MTVEIDLTLSDDYEDWGENDDPENPEPPPRWPLDVALGWDDTLTELAEFMHHRAESCGANLIATVLRDEVIPLCALREAEAQRRDVQVRKQEIEAEEREAIALVEHLHRVANGAWS